MHGLMGHGFTENMSGWTPEVVVHGTQINLPGPMQLDWIPKNLVFETEPNPTNSTLTPTAAGQRQGIANQVVNRQLAETMQPARQNATEISTIEIQSSKNSA